MRIVKLGIICIVVLLVVSSGLSLLFPSHLRVTRSVNIGVLGKSEDSVRAAVMGVVTDLRTWEHWETFVKGGAANDRHYSEPSQGAGAWFKSGSLSIAETAVGIDSVHYHWELSTGKRFESGFYLFRMQRDSLTVQEWMDFRFRWYPWERLGILLYDKRLGPVLEESLAGLTDYVNKTP